MTDPVTQYRTQLLQKCKELGAQIDGAEGGYIDLKFEQFFQIAEWISAQALANAQANNLSWAVGRWHDEVKNRPMINVHRRTLDDCWRACVKRFGGDPDALLGPSHDVLRSHITTAEWLRMGGALGEHVNKVRYEYLRDSRRLYKDPDLKIVVCGNGGEDVLTDEQLDAAVDAEMGATGRPGFTGS